MIPTPDFPDFYYMLGGNLGSLLYGDVSVIGSFDTIMFILAGNEDLDKSLDV